VREAIVAAEFPRLITGLAPVLVRNIDGINLKKLHLELAAAGLERRLAWLVENTLEAVRRETPAASTRWRRLYGRARVVLEAFLSFLTAEPEAGPRAPDILDSGIRSKQTLDEVAEESSAISRRWGIVTSLQPENFADALKEARGARP
jgi:hypothetical protein